MEPLLGQLGGQPAGREIGESQPLPDSNSTVVSVGRGTGEPLPDLHCIVRSVGHSAGVSRPELEAAVMSDSRTRFASSTRARWSSA